MKTSSKGLQIIKDFEGLRLEAYLCPSNVWTIGYGHTGNVKQGDKITSTEAERLLRNDLNRFEQAVTTLVKVPINQNQFDALVSFTFNVGVNAFKNSTLLRLLNAKNYYGASNEFFKWNKGNGGKVLTGLTRRRTQEAKLFSTKI